MLIKFRFDDQASGIERLVRITLQEPLANLRSEISNATGLEDKTIQHTFDQYAMWIHMGGEVPAN